MKKFILSILILLIAIPGFAQYGQIGGIKGITFDGDGLVFGSPADSVIFEIPVSFESTITITTLIGTSFKVFDTDQDSIIAKPSGFNITNSSATGIYVFQVKDGQGSLNAFSVDSLGNVIMAGDVAPGDDVLLADGAVVGITGNEVITFNAAGSINFTGATVDIDGGLTASTVTSDAGIIGTSVNPAVTNVGTLGDITTIWNTGTSGTWTLGDDSDNVSGQLNFIASDNDQGNIAITTDDILAHSNFSGGYTYDFMNTITIPSGNVAMNLRSTENSGAGTGVGLLFQTNDGAAMGSGHRLGFHLFGGAEDGANTFHNAAGFESFATELWSSSQNGADFRINTTANGATTRTDRIIIANGGNVGIGPDTTPDALLDVQGAMQTDAGITIGTTTIYVPNAASNSGTSVADDAAITVTNTIMRMVGADAEAVLDTDPAVNDGIADGQIVIIQGTADANLVTIADNVNTQLAGGLSMTLGDGDMLALVWDENFSFWLELYRSDN